MSAFTKEKMYDLADKLLIGLSDEEADTLLKEFDVIKESMDIISSIEGLDKVEPQHYCTDFMVSSLREDTAKESLPIEDVLKNCDSAIDRMIEVPKVVGD